MAPSSCNGSTLKARRPMGRPDIPLATPLSAARPARSGAPRRARMRCVELLLACTPSAAAYGPLGTAGRHTHAPSACANCDQQQQLSAQTSVRLRSREAVCVLEVGPPKAPLVEEPPTSSTLGVMLLNLGGPDTLDDVEPFLYNLFSDPEIITLPEQLQWLNGPLAWVIARTRAPLSREGYASIGGGSPQLKTTEKQGAMLVQSLARRGVDAKSYVAMRYWSPFTEDALAAIKADGIERLVVLPLYPQFSISTSGSSLRLLERQFYADQSLRQVRNVVIPAWYNREGYVNALARLIATKCDASNTPSEAHIFFSAHGLPKKYIENLADPYQAQTEATVAFVMERMRQVNRMACLSHPRLAPSRAVSPSPLSAHAIPLSPLAARLHQQALARVPVARRPGRVAAPVHGRHNTRARSRRRARARRRPHLLCVRAHRDARGDRLRV